MRTYDGLTNQAGRTPHPSGHPFSEIILYLPLYIHLSIHLRSQSPVLSLLYSATLCTFARATIWPPTCSFVSNASNIYLPSSNVLPMQLSFHFISQSNTLNVHESFRSSTISLALSLSLSLFLSSSLLVPPLLLFLHPLHPPPLSSTMLQMGDVLPCFSAVFLLLLLGTRSATGASLLTVFLYVFLMMFRFPPVPTYQAGRVLRPRAPSGGVSVVASRGGTHDAPENTVAAIREASRNGATGVQLDLSFTADGVPVLMHDETVDRTTNGSGPVNKLQIVQLRRLDAAAHHRLKDKFSAEKVPTLQEAVEECIKHQLTIFFDVKGQPDKSASVLHQMYKKFPALYNSSVVSSFEPKVIYKMRQTDPNVVTALIHRPWRLSHFADATPRSLSVWGQIWLEFLDVLLDWAHHHILWKLCGVSAVLIQKDFISVDYVQYWAERGVEVVGWTVNTAVEKDFYQNLLKIGYITDSLLEDCDPQY